MKRSLYMVAVLLFLGIFAVNFTVYQVHAKSSKDQGKNQKNDKDKKDKDKKDKNKSKHKPTPKPKPTPTPRPTPTPADCSEVEGELETCNENLDACIDDLAACEAQPQRTLPGDGYSNPDSFGVSGHGPALSYTDNGDGTFTDNNTGLMWEIKDDAGGIHDKDNTYTWTDTGDANNTNPDGTLFTVFLNGLNNTCDGAGVTPCASDADCAGIGGEVCGLAGHQDWKIPNVKELVSIVDYSVLNPSSSVPGFTQPSFYWSTTTLAGGASNVWLVGFDPGSGSGNKSSNGYARAVRP